MTGNAFGPQVVYFVCMAGRIESALHDPAEEQEVRAAMESVFPFSMLAQFLTLPRSDKEMQLCELPYIVMGICLFNQATGSSAGKALTSALEASISLDTSTLLKTCQDHIHTITRVLHCYTGDNTTASCSQNIVQKRTKPSWARAVRHRIHCGCFILLQLDAIVWDDPSVVESLQSSGAKE